MSSSPPNTAPAVAASEEHEQQQPAASPPSSTPPATAASPSSSSKRNHRKQQKQQQEDEAFAAAEKNNTRELHKDYSKGGMSIRRRLHQKVDDPLEFDPMSFQGLRFDEIQKLRNEIHHRCKISNGTSWKSDVERARTARSESKSHNNSFSSLTTTKQIRCEGSQLLLNPEPVRRHISTPRIHPDASIAKRMGDITITPGPTDYFPRPVTSNVNSRWIGFLPSAPAKRLDDEDKKVRPSPQSYTPHKPLGAEREQYTIGKRHNFCHGGDAEEDPNRFTGPTSYPPPISDFDMNRKRPNGATAARFYVTRSMHHHAPGPLDTAPSTVTNWIWRDTRSKKWNTGGHPNYMSELDPLPRSEVQARKKRQEAYDRKVKEQQEKDEQDQQEQEQQQNGEGQQGSETKKKKKASSSSNSRNNNSMYKHIPALLLLHELHKKGYQLLRLVSAAGSSSTSPESDQKQQNENSTTTNEDQTTTTTNESSKTPKKKNNTTSGTKKKNSSSTATVFHIASKFSVTNGHFSLKDGVSKEGVAFDVTSKYLVNLQNRDEYLRPPWEGKKVKVVVNEETGEEKEEPYKPTEQEVADHEEKCRNFVNEEVAKGVEWFLSKNEDLAKRAKGRDFTYCSWFERMLKNESAMEYGDAPLRIDEEPISGTPYTATIKGNRLSAPPLK